MWTLLLEKKGYTIDQIAELLEYPVDEIEPIIIW